jgi:hypothetical protein
VRAIFDAPTTTPRERKQLLRAIVAEVVVTVRTQDRQADVRILWDGGACSDFMMELNRTGATFRVTPGDTLELVRLLAASYDDHTIALILGRQQRRTATGLPFTKARVASLRATHKIPAFCPGVASPADDSAPVVGIVRAGQMLGVSTGSIYR